MTRNSRLRNLNRNKTRCLAHEICTAGIFAADLFVWRPTCRAQLSSESIFGLTRLLFDWVGQRAASRDSYWQSSQSEVRWPNELRPFCRSSLFARRLHDDRRGITATPGGATGQGCKKRFHQYPDTG